MATDNRQTLKAAKAKPRGKPFAKGGDGRRHMAGPLNQDALRFKRTLRELLIAEGETDKTDKQTGITKKKVEWLALSVWQQAIKGQGWAVIFIAERTEGRVVQPV